MRSMERYVTRNDAGTLRIIGSRVSLASIVNAYWRGETPEAIAQSFPSLSLEQVHGALAYYLRRRRNIDQELEQQEEVIDKLRSAAEETNRELRERLLESRVGS